MISQVLNNETKEDSIMRDLFVVWCADPTYYYTEEKVLFGTKAECEKYVDENKDDCPYDDTTTCLYRIEEVTDTITKDLLREILTVNYRVVLSNTEFKKTKRDELITMLRENKAYWDDVAAKAKQLEDEQATTPAEKVEDANNTNIKEEEKVEEVKIVPTGDFTEDKYYPEEQQKTPEEIKKEQREALDEALLKEFKVKGISLAHRNSLKKKIWNDAVSVTITSTKNGEEVKEIRLHILEKKLNQIIKNEYKDEYAEYFEKYGVIPNTILKRIKDILCYYEFLKFRPTEVYDKNRRRTVENRYYINKELCNPYLTEQAEQK